MDLTASSVALCKETAQQLRDCRMLNSLVFPKARGAYATDRSSEAEVLAEAGQSQGCCATSIVDERA